MKEYANISLKNYSYVFKFEKEFVFQESADWMIKNWTNGFYCVTLYVLVVFGGKHIMQNKPPINLRFVLLPWNLVLAIFSIMGAIRTIPEFMHTFLNYGFYGSVCCSSFAELDRVSGFWTWLFTLSKAVELGDTVFIVLQKKPLIFLHWYHHVITLLYAWYSYTEVSSSARWFMVMNYSVHSLMYSYYALRTMRFNPPRQIPMLITILQIFQMAMALVINIFGLHVLNRNLPCGISYRNLKISFAMYLSYFILFANLFYKSYMSAKPNKKVHLNRKSNGFPSSKTKVH